MNARTPDRKRSTSPDEANSNGEFKAISVWIGNKLHEDVKVRASARGLSVSAHLRMLAIQDINRSNKSKAKSA